MARAAAKKEAKREARKARKVGRSQGQAELLAIRRANPLANRPWGNYYGDGDQAWGPYSSASGETRALLGKIVLQPRSKWFGEWIGDGEIEGKVRDYIASAQGGDPDALVQLATFRVKPWEHDACRSVPSAAQAAGYRAWTDGLARGIGDSPVAITLQADGPFALCAPGGSQAYSSLIRYSAQKPGRSRTPRSTSTPAPRTGSGVTWTRRCGSSSGRCGIRPRVLHDNTRLHSLDQLEVAFGAEVVEALAARGIEDKHFVVNTSSNGKPFPGSTYAGKGHFDNADVCRSLDDTTCVTLGIPPRPPRSRTRPGACRRRTAARRRSTRRLHVDRAPVGCPCRPTPFDLQRALQLVPHLALREVRRLPVAVTAAATLAQQRVAPLAWTGVQSGAQSVVQSGAELTHDRDDRAHRPRPVRLRVPGRPLPDVRLAARARAAAPQPRRSTSGR